MTQHFPVCGVRVPLVLFLRSIRLGIPLEAFEPRARAMDGEIKAHSRYGGRWWFYGSAFETPDNWTTSTEWKMHCESLIED